MFGLVVGLVGGFVFGMFVIHPLLRLFFGDDIHVVPYDERTGFDPEYVRSPKRWLLVASAVSGIVIGICVSTCF